MHRRVVGAASHKRAQSCRFGVQGGRHLHRSRKLCDSGPNHASFLEDKMRDVQQDPLAKLLIVDDEPSIRT